MSELQDWIIKRIGSMFLTDEQRRELWGLPKGVVIREFARIIPFDKWKNNLTIAEDVWIGEGVILDCSEKLTIGKGTRFGAYTQVYTHSAALQRTLRDERVEKPVEIGEHSWIGPLCVVYPGVKIGDRVIVLPVSVVNRDLPSDTIWGGNPIRQIEEKKKD